MAEIEKKGAPNSGKDTEELVNDLMLFEIIMIRYSETICYIPVKLNIQ